MIEVEFVDGDVMKFDSLVYNYSISNHATMFTFGPKNGKTGARYYIPVSQVKWVKIP